jgi:hypothetical protein
VIHVSAVVVWWSPFEQRIAEGDRIAWVHGDELAAWLRQQPPKLDQIVRNEIVAL